MLWCRMSTLTIISSFRPPSSLMIQSFWMSFNLLRLGLICIYDCLTWMHSNFGEVTCREAYCYIRYYVPAPTQVKYIRSQFIPPPRSTIVWRLLCGCLPTHDVLQLLGTCLAFVYYICRKDCETVEHIFILVLLLAPFGILFVLLLESNWIFLWISINSLFLLCIFILVLNFPTVEEQLCLPLCGLSGICVNKLFFILHMLLLEVVWS